MYYEFYIDVFFVVNLLVDFLLLTLTNQALGGSASPLRNLLAAAAGALGACVLTVFHPGNFTAGKKILHLALAVFMVKAACRIKSPGKMVRGICVFYGASFLLGGILSAVPMGKRKGILQFFTITFTAYWAIHIGIRLCKYLKGKDETFCEAVIWLNGKSMKVKGLYDTGNRLRDPLTGKPVCVMEMQTFFRLLKKEEQEVLKGFFGRAEERKWEVWQRLAVSLKPRLVPYSSVGCENGLLLVVTADGITISSGEKKGQVKHPVIGLSQTPLSPCGNFQIIISPEIADSRRGAL